MLSLEDCWAAVQNRDQSADGKFVYGVLTTGVYCRPSCCSRRPQPKNVRFYDTPQAAEKAGFRPCLRCHPQEENGTGNGRPEARAMQMVCAEIEKQQGENVSLATLARIAGLSPYHLQRTFKRIVGVSPKKYAEACRLRRFKSGLRRAGNVTTALYEAGYGSASRVYEHSDARLGMTPGEYRDGGAGVAISYAVTETRLGLLLIAATDRGICLVHFGESGDMLLHALQEEFPSAQITPMRKPYAAGFTAWMTALNRHLSGLEPAPRLPLDVRAATAFQMKVWKYLQSIPAGETRTYAQVAAAIGKPRAHRAVASACARNKIALLIPCHRVIRQGGALGGYRWNLSRKRQLLEMEKHMAVDQRSGTRRASSS
jgi:AraC family transcriptional regulator of adaptative response/methylated-DNA-[protein]-cysteine methyltransferase